MLNLFVNMILKNMNTTQSKNPILNNNEINENNKNKNIKINENIGDNNNKIKTCEKINDSNIICIIVDNINNKYSSNNYIEYLYLLDKKTMKNKNLILCSLLNYGNLKAFAQAINNTCREIKIGTTKEMFAKCILIQYNLSTVIDFINVYFYGKYKNRLIEKDKLNDYVFHSWLVYYCDEKIHNLSEDNYKNLIFYGMIDKYFRLYNDKFKITIGIIFQIIFNCCYFVIFAFVFRHLIYNYLYIKKIGILNLQGCKFYYFN